MEMQNALHLVRIRNAGPGVKLLLYYIIITHPVTGKLPSDPNRYFEMQNNPENWLEKSMNMNERNRVQSSLQMSFCTST